MKSGLPIVVLAYVGGALLGVSAMHVFDDNPTWLWLVMMAVACGIYAVRLMPPMLP